jgi:predicted nucleotidyltransferase
MTGRSDFLAARIPRDKKLRLEELAAQRGTTVEVILGSLVDQALAGTDSVPDLGEVIRRLRSIEPELRARGIRRLCLFGSLARGEAGAGSDVDLVADLASGLRLNIVQIGSIQARVEELLGHPVDFGLRGALAAEAAVEAERDAIEIFA